jgi:sporulation protein YlmC with PRC-barrel domain
MEMGCVEHRDVITKDGRKIGTLVGATIETSDWTVPTFHLEVAKGVAEEFRLKTSLMKGAKISLPTSFIGTIGDVIQLNVEMEELKEKV